MDLTVTVVVHHDDAHQDRPVLRVGVRNAEHIVDPVLKNRRIYTKVVEQPEEAVLQPELLLPDILRVFQPLPNLGEMLVNEAAGHAAESKSASCSGHR